ncbi:universal stress protein [Hansschlegelia plantiphila]|uniref:Universal stress protein n=1 Tax=Hansschlegelia plantiphila TaxID=374655 RepID=A0A9W6J0F9_9HYPH|nr:universal stress protein [Hansschlegelia plantiphila]GLK68520.1 universal stress protein [Hansschlegelia plantiphila]
MSSAAISIVAVEENLAAAPQPAPYSRILIPTDGSDLAQEAVAEALKLAARIGASVVFLTVNKPFHMLALSAAQVEDARSDYERHADAHADRILDKVGAAALEAGVPFESVRRWGAEPYLEIIDVAHERVCDLIAMASHGRKGLSAILLGSVTTKVLTHSSIPVLVCRKAPAARAPSVETLEGYLAGVGVA